MNKIILNEISASPPEDLKKNAIKDQTEKMIEEISDLQRILYAQSKYSLLLVLQGMDASGKDGTVRNVFSKVNPAGCVVTSFKKPTDEEFAHDFLWRVHHKVPRKGIIGIFNRSHYEDVLIQRVHNWIDMDQVHRRYEHINNFERLLEDTGTKVVKIYLHVSKEEQLERLNERKNIPRKYWKHNENDFKEREHWDTYMKAYEDCFTYCSPEIPWNIVPTNKNWFKEYSVAKIVLNTLKSLPLEYPPLES